MRVQRVIWQGVYNYTTIAKTRAKRLTRAYSAWHKKSRSALSPSVHFAYARQAAFRPALFDFWARSDSFYVLSPMRREIASVISVRKVSVSIPVPPFLTISAVFTIAHSHISAYLHQINSRGSDRFPAG